MKLKNIFFLALCFLALSATAQVDRTKAPEPAPAPKINIPVPTTFTLDNGLKVFVVENHKLPRVAFSLQLDRGPIHENDKAGLADITGQLLRHGTTNRDKAKLDEEIDFIGASLSTYSTGIYASSLTDHTDKLLDLMTDVLYHPAFKAEELEKIRKQTLSSLAASKDEPNSIASNVYGAVLYGKDHPYGEIEDEATVKNIKLEDCKNYYNTYFKPNIGYLAIVGDITPKDAKKLAKKYFGDWKSGEVKKEELTHPEQPAATTVALVDRPSSVQSVIRVGYPIDLKPGQPDVIKATVMNQILGGGFSSRLMQNLREDKAYTYGARSSVDSDPYIGNFTASASVRNEVTDSAVTQFMYELKKIHNGEVSDKELNAAKAYLSGSFGRSLENPQTIARFAINTARYNLPKDYYANYLKNVDAVTKADVKAMSEKYILPNHAYILVVGKGDEIKDKLKQFGPVVLYDREGNEVKASDNAIPAGMTGDKVIANYVKAIGGADKINNIKTMAMEMSADVNGRTININMYRKENGAFQQETSMGSMVLSKTVFDGEKMMVTAQGQTKEVTGEKLKEAMYDAGIVPEMNYMDNDIKTELKGVSDVDGTKAYRVEVTYPTGKTKTDYYAVDTFYKLKEEQTVDTPRGKVTVGTAYSDYKEVKGVMFPQTYMINQGFPIKAEVTSLKINEPLPDGIAIK